MLKKRIQNKGLMLQVASGKMYEEIWFNEDIDDGQKAKIFYFIKTTNYLWHTFKKSGNSLN